MLCGIGPLRRLLRLGVRAFLPVNDQSYITFSEGEILFWELNSTHPIVLGRMRRGRGPLLQGCCVDETPVCYYGEYWGNEDREEVRIYYWLRGMKHWQVFYSFRSGTVRHVHSVQFDPFEKRVWATTGDKDQECTIGFFKGSLEKPEFVEIAGGNQKARAVSLIFTENYVYWGSDAGRDTRVDQNAIYRWSRCNGTIQEIVQVSGPVYYSTRDATGRLFFSTAVENSLSETDRKARVIMSVDGRTWDEIAAWEKDRYPFVFGYGVLSFPQGTIPSSSLYITGNGVKGGTGSWRLDVGDEAIQAQ